MLDKRPKPSEFSHFWPLDPSIVFLNHGSFGACPSPVLDRQEEYCRRLESQPVRFLIREVEQQFNSTRMKIADFVNAPYNDLVFVQNATSGVNTVFRSLKFLPGDEIIYTNHIYSACKRVLDYVAEQTGAVLVEAFYDFPVRSSQVIVDAIMAKVTQKTRILLVDHISSATALIHPVGEIVGKLKQLGIDTMIDGAHALGSINLDLQEIGAAYYTANCHKWLSAPKSSAFLYVRPDKQNVIIPVVISHAGYVASSFTERFYWPGTYDPSSILSVADALAFFSNILPGGWPNVMKRNHDLCVAARTLICDQLGLEVPCPDEMIASMATIMLPTPETFYYVDYKNIDPHQEWVYQKYNIEVPFWSWSSPPKRLLRISTHLYNSMEQYRYLANVLKETDGSEH